MAPSQNFPRTQQAGGGSLSAGKSDGGTSAATPAGVFSSCCAGFDVAFDVAFDFAFSALRAQWSPLCLS
jgi:hypothetical protein